jgi:hypothetical protein
MVTDPINPPATDSDESHPGGRMPGPQPVGYLDQIVANFKVLGLGIDGCHLPDVAGLVFRSDPAVVDRLRLLQQFRGRGFVL